jgi:hypothetical protein
MNSLLIFLWWIIKEENDIENIKNIGVDNEKFSFDLDDIKLEDIKNNQSIIETQKILQERK